MLERPFFLLFLTYGRTPTFLRGQDYMSRLYVFFSCSCFRWAWDDSPRWGLGGSLSVMSYQDLHGHGKEINNRRTGMKLNWGVKFSRDMHGLALSKRRQYLRLNNPAAALSSCLILTFDCFQMVRRNSMHPLKVEMRRKEQLDSITHDLSEEQQQGGLAFKPRRLLKIITSVYLSSF